MTDIGVYLYRKPSMTETKEVFMSNPTIFNDPIAEKVNWDRMAAGGASFKTHSLQHSPNGCISFKSTLGSKLFALGFILAPLPFTLFVFFTKWILILVFFFMTMGSILLHKTLLPIVFDLERGYFYKGWLKKNVSLRMQRIECCELVDIHALQIIAEYISGDTDSRGFRSYELNIVKKDATRINVVDHGDLSVLRRDAQILAVHISVPVWDATL